MIKEELESLFEKDCKAFESNGISEFLLKDFDSFILDHIDDGFNIEIFNVYKKFFAMKQQAPDSMKTVLFKTINNYAKDEFAKGNFLSALVLYRFLVVKSSLYSFDYPAIARNLVKLNDNKLYPQFLQIYCDKEENKLLSYIELADFYKEINDYKHAIECYENFLRIDKTKVAVYNITADLYSKLNGSESLERQIELYEQAYIIQPDNRLVLHGLAFGYEKLGNNARAKFFYEKLLQNNPNENDFYNYGCFLIHTGDFKKGHEYFAHRFNIDDINFKYPSDISKKWDFKTDISDKTLLVHCEQGFGDTIMYSRFVPFLNKIAKKVIFVVQKELFNLISNSGLFNGIEILSDENGVDYDLNMALLDVLHALKFESSALSLLKSNYLNVEESAIIDYKNKYIKNDSTFKIGLSLSGDKSANYNDRNIELSKIYSLLKDIPNLSFYNLQKDESSFDGVISLGNTFENFTNSACAVKNMDLIVSTDNVILNLAGALGVDTIGLFNKETNYRWYQTDGENVGWYKSIKPLQAEKQNCWENVFFELVSLVKFKSSLK